MGIRGLENVGIVVDDLEAATAFFVGLGLERLGEGPGGSAAIVEGAWVDRVVGIDGARSEIAMLQTPDGHGRLELMRFLAPEMRDPDRDAPPNTHGIRRLAFTVDDVRATVATVREAGHELLGEVVDHESLYRMCYVRGPEGIIVMFVEELAPATGA
ncbi:VOC family protein [Patulibacter sp.]|uniref:VOC family protein n=1 Tax=Patulibacter sp. TaxID=1912859 RepID=UPI0027230774|nr:VOC family protein [Patulibacter sp.]MDO9410138.1 VOC family protein [Patulibacter sp.]